MKYKIFTLTKNEYDLIEDFINYYGKIFGYENLIIIDNMSDDERVINIYKKYENKINIVYEEGYANKGGDHFTKYMLKEKNNCDYMIGLDTDEFLIYNENNEYHSHDLKNYLDEYLTKNNEYSQIKVRYLQNMPTENKILYNNSVFDFTYFIEIWKGNLQLRKTFYKSSEFIRTVGGNHGGLSTNKNILFSNELCYLHYQYVGKKRQYERSEELVYGLNYINKTDDLVVKFNKIINANNKTHSNGYHRLSWFREYLTRQIVLNSYYKINHSFPSLTLYLNAVKYIIDNKISYEKINDYIVTIKCDHNTKNNSFEELLYHQDIYNKNTLLHIDCVKKLIYDS
jgi:hypothetical protein